MAAAILARKGPVLATAGNFNNDIGVPLTLLRLEPNHEFAVIELGANNRQEISYTTSLVKPQVALINNLAEAHLEGFGSLLGVAKAKGEIFEGLASLAETVGGKATAIINLDSNVRGFWPAHDSRLPRIRPRSVARRMSGSPDQLWETMTNFGFGALTSSGFPGESAGRLTDFSHWKPINQATLAYGYGVSVTPLQLAQAYAVIGDSGALRPISLVGLEQPADSHQVIDEETAIAVRRMLEEVVRPGGTGSKASVDGYRIAGKTGTAWKAAEGGYSEDKYISIFAGLAPASDPRLATVVVIDEPRGELYYGSDVAAPVFADVMAKSLRLLAVAPDAMRARRQGELMQAMAERTASR